MQQFKQNFIHPNPNFHMQIRLSQQSRSPSHHFLHSNAFSHLYKIPPSATRRGCARFSRQRFLQVFPCPGEEMHGGCDVLHALPCSFYCQESEETIKTWTRREIFFSVFLSDASTSRFAFNRTQTVCARELWRRDVEGKCFLFLSYKPFTAFSWERVRFEPVSSPTPPLPSSSHVASSPGLFMHWMDGPCLLGCEHFHSELRLLCALIVLYSTLNIISRMMMHEYIMSE